GCPAHRSVQATGQRSGTGTYQNGQNRPPKPGQSRSTAVGAAHNPAAAWSGPAWQADGFPIQSLCRWRQTVPGPAPPWLTPPRSTGQGSSVPTPDRQIRGGRTPPDAPDLRACGPFLPPPLRI